MRGLVIGALRIIAVASVIAGASFTVATLTTGLPSIVSLALTAAGGLLGYLLMFALVPPVRRDVLSVVEVVRRALLERRRPETATAGRSAGR